MTRFVQARLIALIILAPLVLSGCTDSPLDAISPSGLAHLQFRANLASTAVSTLVVEVTARDIPVPLIFNIEVQEGVAAGQVTVPAGSERTVTVRAYDAGGVETHRGSTTLSVREGTNPTVSIALTPLMGTQPVSASIGSTVIGLSPGVVTLGVGDTVRLKATVFGVNGDSVTGGVVWATVNPARASVDSTGLVTALTPGSVQIVGTFKGAGGAATINVSDDSVGGGGEAPGGDITPPTLNGFHFTPDSLDVSDGMASVNISLSVADAQSGVSWVSADFRSPSWNQSQSCHGRLANGTAVTGTWTCEMSIPQHSEAGDWVVSYVSVSDVIGNSRSIHTDDLEAAGYRTRLTVASASADSIAPSLNDFLFAPDSIDVSEGAASVSASFELADAGSGVSWVSADFHSPSRGQSRSCNGRLSSGTVASGTWTCEVSVPQHSEAGDWVVSYVSVSDEIGNFRSIHTEDLRAAGYGTQLTVLSASADSVAPSLNHFVFAPDSIDVSEGAASASVRFELADAGSGVSWVSADFHSPSRGQSRSCNGRLSSGTVASGTWTCEMSIPQHSEAGDWIVAYVWVSDVIGNSRSISTEDLQDAGFSTKLHVVSR